MEWVLLVAALGGGGAIGWTKLRRYAAERQERAADLQIVRRLAAEDVTVLGEQLRALDERLAGAPLDTDAQRDYQTALDAYESAGRAAERLRSPTEVSSVVDTLSHGRYAIVCVEARVAGETPPEWKPPCFFDPRHGPSVTSVMWTPRGRGTRTVPACAQDAARIAEHERPEVRMVELRGRKIPYWQAGEATAPYTEGYFVGSAGMAWAYTMATPIMQGGHTDASFGTGGDWMGGDWMGGGDGGGGDGGGGF